MCPFNKIKTRVIKVTDITTFRAVLYSRRYLRGSHREDKAGLKLIGADARSFPRKMSDPPLDGLLKRHPSPASVGWPWSANENCKRVGETEGRWEKRGEERATLELITRDYSLAIKNNGKTAFYSPLPPPTPAHLLPPTHSQPLASPSPSVAAPLHSAPLVIVLLLLLLHTT